jgi:hypothetical protein
MAAVVENRAESEITSARLLRRPKDYMPNKLKPSSTGQKLRMVEKFGWGKRRHHRLSPTPAFGAVQCMFGNSNNIIINFSNEII